MSVTAVTSLAQLKSQDFQGLAVVSFWAAWSEPSKQMNTVLGQLASQYANVKFGTVEAEEVDDVTEKYKVESVPTVLFLKHGEVAESVKGSNPPEVVKKLASFAQSAVTTGVAQAPAPKTEASKEQLHARLTALVNQAPVMAFIKGSPDAPQCGFSAKFCKILKDSNIEFGHFNILSDETVRNGLKEFSNWPTYPQLYVKGKLVGGFDIVKQLAESGDLLDAINGEN
eukprot:TRINITY_DN12932_c0_g1_i1.p1 TRINITY_DN12932_c0_g1~~TRINITY_DN12932_c0_g1_i1.p1  ORF type:complete len:227 (-),score=75.21 TRINITY_DN12932_c0_g1_i1:68-748(-)